MGLMMTELNQREINMQQQYALLMSTASVNKAISMLSEKHVT